PVRVRRRALGQLLVLPALRGADPRIHAEWRLLCRWPAAAGLPGAAGMDAGGLVCRALVGALATAAARTRGAHGPARVVSCAVPEAGRLVGLLRTASGNHGDLGCSGDDGHRAVFNQQLTRSTDRAR